MTSRFFGRVNLSKSGASVSIGNRGNVINFSPRSGIRHTVGIQPARSYADGKINTLAEASLAIAEATFAKAALAFEKAEALAPQMSEEQRAELEIKRAELAKLRLMLEQYRRAQRDAGNRTAHRAIRIHRSCASLPPCHLALIYLLLFAAGWRGWMVMGTGMMAFLGLYWLWADFINADPRPEKARAGKLSPDRVAHFHVGLADQIVGGREPGEVGHTVLPAALVDVG